METTTSTFTRRPARALLAAIPLVLSGALLAGCSAATTTGSTSDDGASTSGGASATTTTASGDLATVGAAALKAAGSGTIISIEREDIGTWEVLLSTDDGTETELHLTADGSVTAGPSAKPGDAEDAAENSRYVAAATLDYRQAAAKITAAQAGDVTELNLDDHAGAVVWEADVIDSAGTKHSVRIDAGSGAVVSSTTGGADDD